MREDGSAVYLLSGGRARSDWVRNLRADPNVTIRFGSPAARTWRGLAREVSDPDEDALARRLLLRKYEPGYSGDLTSWGRASLPVAVEPVEEEEES
jgi:hypothetical protein